MQAILAYIQKEWAVVSKAPFTFLGIAALFVGAGYGAGAWHYAERISVKDEQIIQRNEQIARYRVALGVDSASRGILIDLTNQELQAKSANTVKNLRDTCFSLRKKDADIRAQFNAGKIDKNGLDDRLSAMNKEMSEKFVRYLRSDAFNVDNELRRRLGPQAVAAIVGITPSVVSDDGTRIDVLGIIPSGVGFDVSFTCVLADGIEQMAKLLPPDSQKQ